MKTRLKNAALVLSVSCIVLLAGAVRTTEQTAHPGPILPGARPVIDAGDCSSLQAAVDRIPPDGGIVRIPPGTFEITEPLRIAAGDVLLQGAGAATHIVNTSREGTPAIVIRHPDGGKKRRSSLWRVQVADLRVTGNPDSGTGIVARRINEIFIHGVTVSRHGGDGILLDACYEDPRVCDALITYNKRTGLNLAGCHDIVVSGNHFEENHDAVRCTDGFNLCMTGNNLDDHIGDGVVIENTYGSVVTGNMIEECRGTAIVLDRDCYGIALSANVIAHNASGGIDLRDAHGCTVAANAFTIAGKRALGIGPRSGRITVAGNTFADSYVGAGTVKRGKNDRAAAGMVLESTGDVAVSGNLFAGLSTKALRADGADNARILFSGNVLTDVESDHAQLKHSLVEGNLEPR